MELIKRYWGIIPEQDLGMPLRGKLNLQAIAIPPTPLPCTRIMPASTHSCSPHFSSYVSKAEDKPSIWDSQNLSISIICSALLHFCDLETYQPKGKEWITWSIKKIPVDGECGSKPVCPRGEKFFSICLGILEILFFGVFFFLFPKEWEHIPLQNVVTSAIYQTQILPKLPQSFSQSGTREVKSKMTK